MKYLFLFIVSILISCNTDTVKQDAEITDSVIEYGKQEERHDCPYRVDVRKAKISYTQSWGWANENSIGYRESKSYLGYRIILYVDGKETKREYTLKHNLDETMSVMLLGYPYDETELYYMAKYDSILHKRRCNN